MATRRYEFITGVKDELPILAGVAPFGMIYGVSALSAHIPAITAQAMSSVVFAGASQFIIAQLVMAGTPPIVIILTAFIVNIRHMLYSASLAPFVKQLPMRWKWLLAYLLTDEAYAVTISHYRKSEDETQKHWYFFGAGLALWTTWQISTAIGIFLGTQVPASWSLDFTSTLTFIALVVPALKDRASAIAALTGGIVAVLLYALPFKLGLGIASLIGIIVGLWVETLRQRKNTNFLRGNL